MQRKYYEAYDDRYRQIHGQNLQWFADNPTPIVMETVRALGIGRDQKILELGCGEGRDAIALLQDGYDLLATDISAAAIAYAQNKFPEFKSCFAVLDGVHGEIPETFDFIYAVAVVHMLVEDADRDGLYAFIRTHLKPGGKALICTMGDGKMQRQTDVGGAFDVQDRVHEPTGRTVQIANTSCRMVSFATFREELKRNGLEIIKEGITAAMPDFSALMFAVVKGGDL